MRELYVRNRYCLNKALAAVEHGSKVSVYVPHIYSGLQLVQRNPAAVAQHLSADVLTDGSGSYSRKHARDWALYSRIFKLSLALVQLQIQFSIHCKEKLFISIFPCTTSGTWYIYLRCKMKIPIFFFFMKLSLCLKTNLSMGWKLVFA